VAYGDFQFEIYLAGMTGERPKLPMTYAELKRAAHQVLSPEAAGYVAGGAGAEETMHANRGAFRRWQIVPRMLRQVAERDLSVELFGQTLPAPVLCGPVGVLGIVHPDAERAVAAAVTAVGVPMVLSTVSSYSIEDVGAVLDGHPAWFQLYWPKDREVAASLVERAERSGFSAIVVTLDTWALAWRPRDLGAAYLPFLQTLGLVNYFSDPAFRAGLAKPPEEDPQAAVLTWAAMFGNPALTWSDIAWLRERTRLPVVVKGICHPDDARAAAEAGVAGIIVSNHGGRQVDGARPALDCLPDVAAAVPDLPLLFDSGVRSGADAVKALALGARAVLVARPYVYGLALAGTDGVRHVLRCLLADLDLTLALAGHSRPTDLTPAILHHATPTRL
jgi:isopentenyl diphosphate isomerase/L-lactate dehydrogenase-like FMN-dependent dehydrogenase